MSKQAPFDDSDVMAYAVAELPPRERAEFLLAVLQAVAIAAADKVIGGVADALPYGGGRPTIFGAHSLARSIARLPQEGRDFYLQVAVIGEDLSRTVMIGSCDGRPSRRDIDMMKGGLRILLRNNAK